VELISIVPVKKFSTACGEPSLARCQVRLPDCRRSWWLTRRTTCLANQWAVVRKAGRIEILRNRSECKADRGGEYDPGTRQVHVVFQDGTTDRCNYDDELQRSVMPSTRGVAPANRGRDRNSGEAVRYVPSGMPSRSSRPQCWLLDSTTVIGALQDVPTRVGKLSVADGCH